MEAADEPSPRRPGRPPTGTETSVLSIRVPVSVYDRVIRLARAERKSVSDVVKEHPEMIRVNNKHK